MNEIGEPASGTDRAPDLLTISVEDYFHTSGFKNVIQRRQWYRFERRVERNTLRALDLLDEFGVRATFFTLGSVAEEMPEVVRTIADRGHEVATKGYHHRDIDDTTPGDFREDLQRSVAAIERATGMRVHGHRLARGHLKREHSWVPEILADEGLVYDSSVYPRFRSAASEPWRRLPHSHSIGNREIHELPYATWSLGGFSLPIAGGNALRQLPHALMQRLIQDWHRRHTHPFVMYFHIWELDAELPRISAAPSWTTIRQYRNLDRMPSLIRHYLSTYRFRSIAEHLDLPAEPVPAESRSTAAIDRSPAVRTSSPTTPVTIVVPCFNEESVLPYLENTLRSVAKRLGSTYDLQFLFVDDGSTDETWEVLQATFSAFPKCRFFRHDQNRGVAAAILTGIENSETEIVCSIDCDCTYDPHQLQTLIPALEDDVAIVTASPYHPNGRVLNVPGWRLAMSKSLSALYRRVLHQTLWTYTSCFRVYRRSMVVGLPVTEGGFLGVAEMLGILDQRGLKIVERPAVLEVRMLGQSKMKLAHTIRGHLRLLARFASDRTKNRTG